MYLYQYSKYEAIANFLLSELQHSFELTAE